LNAFAYLDASLEAFCERLQSKPDVWRQTLVVVTGDHTSVRLRGDDLERLRIPLIFYGPGLPERGRRDEVLASQIDVLPTVLGMMPGEHPFAGLGRNLLKAGAPATGVVSTRMDKGMFLKDGYMLIYDPSADETSLYSVDKDKIGTEDLSPLQPELARDLRRQYFSQIELAKRLAVGKRIFPLTGVGVKAAVPTEIPIPE
jgi:phosphoglycerol transferase MdoB-like AlkP superfamily enzyme